MTAAPLLLPLLVCAVVLLVSGVAKVRHPTETGDAFRSLRVPAPGWAPRALPRVEIVLGAALLVVPGSALLVPAVLVAGLFTLYTVVIARALRFEEPVRCSCFGALGAHQVSVRTLVRNLALVAAGVLTIVAALREVSVPSAMTALTGAQWAWLALAGLAALVSTLSLGGVAGDEAPGRADTADDDEYIRLPIPLGQGRTHDDRLVTLDDLARQRPALLISVDPGCGPCARVIPQLLAWKQQFGASLDLRALYPPAPGLVEDLAPETTDLALYDTEHNITRVLRMGGYPSAILLGADGLIAGGPVTGEHDVVEFVDDVRAALSEADLLPVAGGPATRNTPTRTIHPGREVDRPRPQSSRSSSRSTPRSTFWNFPRVIARMRAITRAM